MNGIKLTNFPVAKEVEVVNDSIHHLWILDRSGSMYGVLPKVIEDLKRQARTLQKGDALTFGYFSSKGQYGFPIKLFRIVDESSYGELDRLFDQHKQTLGLTCFSEILNETIQVIKDASFLSLKTAALFFSDGYANDRSQSEEYKLVREIMPKLGESLDMFLSVAHSDYADKDFLAEMAELSGGESVGSNSLEAFTRLMDKYLRASSKLTPRQVVEIGLPKDDVLGIFSYGEDTVNTFSLRDDGSVQSSKDVWVLTKGELDSQTPEDTLYATALVLSRKGNVDLALDILNKLGDKYLIDLLNNAFTPSERGVVEDKIKEAVFNKTYRFLDGKVENYLPDPNAFCVLDLVELLSNDSEARFYPRHPNFRYNAIGRKPITEDGYEKFNAYLENHCPIGSFTWNKEQLNLSMLATVKGTVKLNDEANLYDRKKNESGTSVRELTETISKPKSLGGVFETFQWKNYTLIKDGFKNITRLPISASPETIKKLAEEGLLGGNFNYENLKVEDISKTVFTLDLSNIPVVNKAIASRDITAKELLSNVLEETMLQGEIKVLNSLRKEVAPDAPKKDNDWTDEEREFLLASGFREDGSYSPPSTLEDPTDHYDAVVFKVGIKGLSSFPSLKDLVKRMDSVSEGKELTLPMTLMAPTLEDYTAQVKALPTDEQVEWIDSRLNAAKLSLAKVRSQIQKPKFALILGKRWFSDLEKSEAEQTVVFPTNRIAGKSEMTGVIQIYRKEIKI